ncbi:MAG: lysophospholipid acyltransferase family protein [Bacilli bacterium]
MVKYLRLGFRLLLELFAGYLFIILPNVWFKRRIPLEKRYTSLRKIIHGLYKTLRIKLYINDPSVTMDKGPYFIVCNHHSMLDPFLLIYLFEHPVRFIAKKEVRRLLIFGDATASIDALFINRKSVRSQLHSLETMKESLIKKDTHWLAFPEATRNKQYSNPMLPFKAGTFKQAMEAKATILPMVTYGFFRPLDPKIDWKQYPVQVEFLDKITPEMYEGKSTIEVAEMIRNLMQIRSDKIRLHDAALPRK